MADDVEGARIRCPECSKFVETFTYEGTRIFTHHDEGGQGTPVCIGSSYLVEDEDERKGRK